MRLRLLLLAAGAFTGLMVARILHHEAQHDAASLRYIEWTALSYSPD